MTTPNTAQQERLALAMKMAVEFGWLAKSVTYEEYLCACVNMQALLDACAPAAQTAQLPVGPALHVPSGFVFDEVLAAAVPSDLVPLTPQPVDTAQPAAPAGQAQNYDQPAYLKERHDYWIAEFKAFIEKAGLDYFLSYQAGMAANRDNARRFSASPQPRQDVVEALRKKVCEVEALLTNMQPHIPQACHPRHVAFIDNYVNAALQKLRAALQSVQGGGN